MLHNLREGLPHSGTWGGTAAEAVQFGRLWRHVAHPEHSCVMILCGASYTPRTTHGLSQQCAFTLRHRDGPHGHGQAGVHPEPATAVADAEIGRAFTPV